MASRSKKRLDVDMIQLWLSQGISILPNVKRTYDLLMTLLVATDKACWIPVERMEQYSKKVRDLRVKQMPTSGQRLHK